jgi:hypothetical protein
VKLRKERKRNSGEGKKNGEKKGRREEIRFMNHETLLLLSQSRNALLFRYPKVYYRVHKSPPLASVLSQFSPIQNLTSNLAKIYFYILSS